MYMNFSFNKSITEILDVSRAKYLRNLTLDDYRNLITVHESIGFLQNPSDLIALGARLCWYGKDSEKVQTWRSALFEVANLKGQHVSTRIDETTFIEKIVKDVNAHITPKPLHNCEDTVGLEERIKEVESLLNMKPNKDNVSMLGIYGLGGIGKTELAKALYDKIVHQFEAASFLTDVREKTNMINGIGVLQKTLLSEMKEEIDIELGSTGRGINEIQRMRRLQTKKVLLILDDVDGIKSLQQLAGARDWFGLGSRVVITTRDKKLLDIHQVVKIYEMTVLNDQHSLELFCKKAFKQSHPELGYEGLSSRVVGYAKGLPLALKVISSNLATERRLDAWESALKEYEMVPNRSIQDVLKISYERLGDNAKHVFLDIACFYKGKNIKYVEDILKEFCASYNIKVLVDKSLLSVEYGCYLKMHDLIQDMGRAIVNQESTNPGKRKRIWSPEDAIEVLTEDLGSDAIEAIMLDSPQREEVDWSGDALKKMKRLRTLIVRNTTFSSEPKYLPNSLRVLDWEEYPSMSFPPKFYPKKITAFNMPKSNLTLDLPFKEFSHLTYMNFSFNKSITEIPDVSGAKNLRNLTLDDCRNLITVHESVGFLENLCDLSALGCIFLRNFPRKIFLPSLERLTLSNCISLEHFPDVTKKMKKGLSISMMGTCIKKLPDSIGNLTGLNFMGISGNAELEYVPSSLFMLSNVKRLYFRGCCQLGGSLKKILETPSAVCGSSTLEELDCRDVGLCDEDLVAILNFSPELDELKEIYELQMVMPRTEIPEWFDFRDKGGNPRFLAPGGGNFPIFALALVFHMDLEYYECEEDVDLDLVINGRCCACSKDWGGITCAPDHMLICDLRVLFWKEEWLGLDAFLENDWNQVEVVHKGTELTVSSWGIFMYRSQGTNMEDVQFICPDDQFLETDCDDKMRE